MAEGGFWVFGYGSLMWRPGFAHEEARIATLQGFARRFCLRSIRYRGTPEAPGLVLALAPDAGAACTGLAFRVAEAAAAATLAYLRDRELVTYAYREEAHPVRLDDGREVVALAYVADPAHPQFAGGLGRGEQAEIIAAAAGPAGRNADYLFATLDHLAALGIRDAEVEALGLAVRGRLGLPHPP